MGGYGGSSGRTKDKCYYNTDGRKVTDKNAIEAAERYISEGKFVLFLHENPPERHPDLLVEYKMLVEVKGIFSTNPGQISKQIEKASLQIEAELARYPEEKRISGKIVIISRHASFEIGYKAVYEGYQEAKRKDQVHFTLEFWFHGEIHIFE